MIISASRRTDIPAFHAKWFINCIRTGFVNVANPYNPNLITKIELTPQNVSVIVFWTKNPAPLIDYLDEIENGLGFTNYYFMFTLNGYPKIIEPHVPPIDHVLDTFKRLSVKIGKERVIWRFDPIIITDASDENYIVRRFDEIAKALHGYTDKAIFSIAVIGGYKKVLRRLTIMKQKHNLGFCDLHNDIEAIHRIAQKLSVIAKKWEIGLYSCAMPCDLSMYEIHKSKCIDSQMINKIFGLNVNAGKDKYQRTDCGCAESKDIGSYSTCAHGCIYCYANSKENKNKIAI
ncbi:protein of unknown function DUF1848 [Candidatus Magnetoovum chiemensis]|nr:protein of unknown function DUF1848 [Candidatus Magnetoovum chiemensis]